MGLSKELARRRRALAADLRTLGADALLAVREASVTYLTGYTTQTWSNFSRPIVVVLFRDESLSLICAETEADAARERVPEAQVVTYVELRPVAEEARLPDGRVQFGPEVGEKLRSLLQEREVTTVAADGLHAIFPPIPQVLAWAPQWEAGAVDASPLLWAHRLRKSSWEVERLRVACNVLQRAFDTFQGQIQPGQTERRIHSLLAAASFEAGADALGYTNVVAGTDRGLFGAPTERRWEAGEVLYIDGGVIVDGYWADFCRMYTAGRPTPEQAQGYERAYRGLLAGLDAFSEGFTAGDLCRALGEATGIDPGDVGFGRFGHGIGLYMPEPPSVHLADDTPLADGTVLCIEPAVVHDVANYVVEEEHVVREGRLKRISPPAPPALISLI